MRVLITDGAGFIGSHLAEALLARGDEVLILDDLSTGSMENMLCYVGDVIGALLKLVETSEAGGQVFNIGSSEELSIDSLASLIKEKPRSSSEVCHIPYDQAYEEGFEDMLRRVPSIAKIEKYIGWRPITSLDVSIELIARYFEENGRDRAYSLASAHWD